MVWPGSDQRVDIGGYRRMAERHAREDPGRQECQAQEETGVAGAGERMREPVE